MAAHLSPKAKTASAVTGRIRNLHKAIAVGLLIFSIAMAPGFASASDSSQSHRMINHQRVEELKKRVAELRERIKEHKQQHHNGTGGGSMTGSLDTLQARLTSLETSVNTLLSADSTMLATLQAAQTQIAVLQAKVATLESQGQSSGNSDLAKYVTVDPNPINGVNGPHIIFTGANVHIRSGSGATDDNGNPTGLGNLILGYNEPDPSLVLPRNGAHNLVAGTQNAFSSFGGTVFGFRNRLTGQYATILGGDSNIANGVASTVLGGSQGTANGAYATVLGGSASMAATQFSIAPVR